MATLKDIADALNISPALVSKVLSGRMSTTGCSEKTRQSILARAKQVGYRPDPVAVALRSGRLAAVGVFIHPIGENGSGLMERMLAGITETLNARDQQLWLSFYQSGEELLHRCNPRAIRRVDGLIVAGFPHPELSGKIRAIESSAHPVVTVLESPLDARTPNIGSDQFRQGYLATTHLIERGSRRIAHMSVFESRCQGDRQALTGHGRAFEPALVYAAKNFSMAEGTTAVRHWQHAGTMFDGLVAQSDHQAIGAIHELLRQGRRVPDQVRVVGVDDSPLCAASPVPLSSVSQEMHEVGRQAAELVLQRIAGEPVQSVIVPPRLQRGTQSRLKRPARFG